MKIMASGLITSWEIDGETVETESDRKSVVQGKSVDLGGRRIIKKTKIVASGLITSWQIDGDTMETVADLIFLGSKTTQMVTAP